MKDPYEVLGIPRTSDMSKVKSAYRELVKKYHPDNYAGTPLTDLANEKMQEINDAYDAIVSGKANGSYSSSGSSSNSYAFSEVEDLIRQSRLDDAEALLESFSDSEKSAHWYYLKGQINYMRGWSQQAYSYFSMAHNMDPNNRQYAAAFEKMSGARSGGFRTSQRQTDVGGCGGCDGCDICSGLLCADCCCECFGGDLISCC